MTTKAAFIYIAPENDYKTHKAFIDSPVVNLTVVGVKDYEEGLIERLYPNQPKHPKQQYLSRKYFKSLISHTFAIFLIVM